MKISELVKKTNVSKETIHYYIREGALSKPKKSGRNTADYGEETVEQIKLIKDLQENYFLPLSEIKKIVKQQKKLSPVDKFKLQFLTKSIRPIDQITVDSVTGKDNFIKATGMSEKWLTLMEKLEIITPEMMNQRPVYSRDNVIIGKLIVNMDRLGYGPKDGYPPDNLKIYIDFIKNILLKQHIVFLRDHLHLLQSDEFLERGTRLMEVLGLFFYHAFRRTATEELSKFYDSLNLKDDGEAPGNE